MSIVTFKSGDKTALTENFTRSEFACPCGCNSQMIEQELADKIQGIRDKLGKKIRITSGYRCVSHNASKKVGGSKQSRHLYGIAADWRTEDRSVNPVCLGILAQKAGFGGIGIYWHSRGAFVHTDTRGGKATWLCTARTVPQHQLQRIHPPDHQTGVLWSCKSQCDHHAPEAPEGQR